MERVRKFRESIRIQNTNDLLHFLFFPALFLGAIVFFILYVNIFKGGVINSDSKKENLANTSYYYSFPQGIIFQHDKNYQVIYDKETNQTSIIRDDYNKDKSNINGVIISAVDSDTKSQFWIKDASSGFSASTSYIAFNIDGESAFESNSEDWVVFDSGNSNLRFSIATLGDDNESNKKELQTIVDSLFFIHCPDDYTDDDKKYLELQLFTEEVMGEVNSTSTSEAIEHFGKSREHFYHEYGCDAALKRLSDAKNDKADPETMKVIDQAIHNVVNDDESTTTEISTATETGTYFMQETYEKVKSYITKKYYLYKLGRLVKLPKGDSEMFEVTDIDTLKEQQLFFSDAENGDILFTFASDSEAFIYSPTKNKLVNSGPIDLGENSGDSDIYSMYLGQRVMTDQARDNFQKIYRSLDRSNSAKIKVVVSPEAYKYFDMLSIIQEDDHDMPSIYSRIEDNTCYVPVDSKYAWYSYSYNSGNMCYIEAILNKDGAKINNLLNDSYETLYQSKNYFDNEFLKSKYKSRALSFTAFPDGVEGYTTSGDASSTVYEVKIGNYTLKTTRNEDEDSEPDATTTLEVYKNGNLVDTKSYTDVAFHHMYRMKFGGLDYVIFGLCGGGNHGCGVLVPMVYDGTNLSIGEGVSTDFSNYLDRKQFFIYQNELYLNLDDSSNFFNYDVSNNASYNSAVPMIYRFDKSSGNLVFDSSKFLDIYKNAVKRFESDFNNLISKIPSDAVPEVTNLLNGDSLKPYFDYYLNMRKIVDPNDITIEGDTLKMYRQLYGPYKTIDYHPGIF